jgi:hypothetical protein
LSSFMFVDFKNVDDANLAMATINGHPFDAKHIFKVNRFSDIEKYAELDETYVEPELEEYTPRVWLRLLIYSVHSKFYCRTRSIYEHGLPIHWVVINT